MRERKTQNKNSHTLGIFYRSTNVSNVADAMSVFSVKKKKMLCSWQQQSLTRLSHLKIYTAYFTNEVRI